MNIATVAIAYNEERFIERHLRHIPEWVKTKLVLVSTVPWQGEPDELDQTAAIANKMGADVIEYAWKSEHEQRNAGQEYLADHDWIITLDPDEFLDINGWNNLKEFLESEESNHADAYVCEEQSTYWKRNLVIEPKEEYRQVILTRPNVRYFDKRCVLSAYDVCPVSVHHFSWARTDVELLSKISHYAHAHELDPNWYNDVWKTDRKTNLHPLTPEALKEAVPTELPVELERLDLWP